MLDPVFQFAEKFVTDFSWKRVAVLFSVAFLVASCLMAYEWHTASNELTRYERTVELLKNLEALTNSQDERIVKTATQIIEQLSALVSEHHVASSLGIAFSPKFTQAFFAAVPWIFIAFILVIAELGKGSSRTEISNMILGFVFFVVLAAFVGYSIPPTWNGWIRYGAPQFATFLILLGLGWWGNKSSA